MRCVLAILVFVGCNHGGSAPKDMGDTVGGDGRAVDVGAPIDVGTPIDVAIDSSSIDARVIDGPIDAAIDARPIDARPIDAPIDAPPDACIDDGTACVGKCSTTAANNCGGTVTCGATCPASGDVCHDNQCCTPEPNTCLNLFYECGMATDACGVTYNCGSCRTQCGCFQSYCDLASHTCDCSLCT